MFLRICDSNHCYLSLETVVNAVITVAVVVLVIKCFGDTTLERWRAGRIMDSPEEEPQTAEEDVTPQWSVSDWWQTQGFGRAEPTESSSAGLGIQVKRDEPDTDIAMLSAFTFESQPPSPPGERRLPLDNEPKRQKRPISTTPPAKRQKKPDVPTAVQQKTASDGGIVQYKNALPDGDSKPSQRPHDPPSPPPPPASLRRPLSPPSPRVPVRDFLRKGSRKVYRAPLWRSPPPALRYMATTRSLSPPPAAVRGSPPRLQQLEMSLPSFFTSTPPQAVSAIVDYGVGSGSSSRPQLQPRYCVTKASEVKTTQRPPHPYLKSKSALERSMRRSAAIGRAVDRNATRPGHNYGATAPGSLYPDGPGARRNFVSDSSSPRENFAGQIASLIANQYNALVQEYESFRNRDLVRENSPLSQPPTNTFAWPQSSTGNAILATSQNNVSEPESSHVAASNVDEERANSNETEQPQLRAKQALNVFVQESDCTCGTAAPAAVKESGVDSSFNEIQEKQRQEEGCRKISPSPSRPETSRLVDQPIIPYRRNLLQNSQGLKTQGASPTNMEQTLPKMKTKQKVEVRNDEETKEERSHKVEYYENPRGFTFNEGLSCLAMKEPHPIHYGHREIFLKKSWKVVPSFFEEYQARYWLNTGKAQRKKISQVQPCSPDIVQVMKKQRVLAKPGGSGALPGCNKSIKDGQKLLFRPVTNSSKDTIPVAKLFSMEDLVYYPVYTKLMYGCDDSVPHSLPVTNPIVELPPTPPQKIPDPKLYPIAGDIIILSSALHSRPRESSFVYFHLGNFLEDPRKGERRLNGKDSGAFLLRFGEFHQNGVWESNLHVRLFCTTFNRKGTEVWKSLTKTFVTKLPFLHHSRRVPTSIQMTDPHFKPRVGDLILRIQHPVQRSEPSSNISNSTSNANPIKEQLQGEVELDASLKWWDKEHCPICNDMIVRAYIGPAPKNKYHHNLIYLGRVELFTRTNTEWLFMGRDQHIFNPFDL